MTDQQDNGSSPVALSVAEDSPVEAPPAETRLSAELRHASEIVHSVEGIVEHAVEAAERSLAQRLGEGSVRCLVWSVRALAWVALIAYFVFCALVISLRWWWMPHIDDWRGQIEAQASAMLKQQVTIGRIESSWLGINPRLQLTAVELHDPSGAVSLTLPQIDAVISWTSVPTLQVRMKSLTVVAPEVEVRRLSESRLSIAGTVIDLEAAGTSTALLTWALEQRRLAVDHAIVHYYDDMSGANAAPVDMTDVEILLTHHLGTHHFALRARPPSDVADAIDVRGWFDRPWSVPVSDARGWSGRLFAQLNYVDLARLESFARLIPQPFRLHRGSGALRAWIDFDALAVQRARVDLGFTDVELHLRSDAPPLRLTNLQGRITQQAWRTSSAQGQDITLAHLALQGPGGLRLPATDLTYRVFKPLSPADAPLHTDVTVSALSLEDLSSLATRLALPAPAQDVIARYAMRGDASDVEATWDGDPDHVSNFALRAHFERLGMAAQPADPGLDENGRPRPGQPGFENLSGSIDLSPAGGTLALSSSDARLILPGLLEDPEVPASHLSARVHWTTAPALELGIDALAFANDDLDVTVSGTYRTREKSAPWVDLRATLARASAAAVHRYVPLSVGPGARTWLTYALLDGRLSGGTLKLRGNLDQFPFVAHDSGEFAASLHVSNATLDYAPSAMTHPGARPWPVMTALEADVNFNRDQIDIIGGHASVYGVRLSKVAGRIGPLAGKEPRLAISGQGNGEIGDMIVYVNASPVSSLIGGFLQTAKANGPGRMQLKLDIPLNHAADTVVDGSVLLQGNDVALRSDMAPLTAVTGRLDFGQHGIRIAGLSAGFAGGQARIDADTMPGGTLMVKVAGGATPQGLRRQLDSALARRILDNARGMARYALTVIVHGNVAEAHLASDLTGVAIDLPEPLGKVAAEPLPLRVDLTPVPASVPLRDTLRVTLGSVVTVELERAAGAPPDESMHVERGVIAIGTSSVLPESGVLVHVALARLDTDRWLPLLESATEEPSAGSTAVLAPDLVAAHIDELWVSGKPLHNVVVGATRAGDGGWNVNLEADQTSGSLHWVSGTRSAPGKLTARLARLMIPESAREPVTEVLDAPVRELPELDVVADDFVLGSSRLGRLELDARNVRSGRSNTWQLKRVQIDDPDGHISGSGQWEREPGSLKRRMTFAITLDVVNAGNLLGRFGLPGAIKNGAGKLSANLSWLGSPFSIDYSSLSGDVQLSAEKGQFLKADPGAGRLLGVMSLQALPRRISLDFRDIFSAGFAFDTIHATAHINNGVLSTKDFKMVGVGASVLIEGETDLKAESQNLHVLVLPEISATSAPVVYAFIANPAIGVGAFLAQWVLRHPLSKIFSREYDITGSWAEPQVKKRERPKPDPTQGKSPWPGSPEDHR
jgi:uncharacterized protein (TIGR02099 family)